MTAITKLPKGAQPPTTTTTPTPPAVKPSPAGPTGDPSFDALVELSLTIGQMGAFQTMRADPHQPPMHEWRAKIKNTPALVMAWLEEKGFDPNRHTLIAVTFDKNTDVLLCIRDTYMSTLQIVEEGREDGALKRES